MWKWLAGIAASVISAVIIWLITKPAPDYSLTGTWSYTMMSTQSHQTYQGILTLTMDRAVVAGTMENTFDNSSSGVHGSFANNTLELSRETGKDETVQLYRLTKRDDRTFAGTFWNRGRWKDEGTIEITRQ